MELRRYLAILRRRALLIVLAVVVAGAYAWATADRTVTYTATSTLYVGAESFSTERGPDSNLSGDLNAGITQLIRTFATMIDTPTIAADAVALSGAPRSAEGVVASTSAAPVPGTNILRVSVTDVDPSIAQDLANSMTEAFVTRIGEFEPDQTAAEGDVPSAPARIFERAAFPGVSQSPSVASDILVASTLALLLSAGLVLLVEYLDVTLKTPEDAEAKLDLPVIGVVPLLTIDPAGDLRRRRRPGGPLGLARDA